VVEDVELQRGSIEVVVEQSNLGKAGMNLPFDRLQRFLVRRLL
jgi:hypothetical protein